MGRTKDLSVDCSSGYSSCDHPSAVWWHGQHRLVKAIIAEWRTPVEKHYCLLATENCFLEAVLNEKENTWKIERIKFESIE
jgi:hypothetical protein